MNELLKDFYTKNGIDAEGISPREEILFDLMSKDLDIFVKNSQDLQKFYVRLNKDSNEFQEEKRKFNWSKLSTKWGSFGAFFGSALLLLAMVVTANQADIKQQIKDYQTEISFLHNKDKVVRENDQLRAEINQRDSKTCWGVWK